MKSISMEISCAKLNDHISHVLHTLIRVWKRFDMVLQNIAVCKIHGSMTWRNQKYVNEFHLIRPKTSENSR